jgi:hypothetical protein
MTLQIQEPTIRARATAKANQEQQQKQIQEQQQKQIQEQQQKQIQEQQQQTHFCQRRAEMGHPQKQIKSNRDYPTQANGRLEWATLPAAFLPSGRGPC